MRLRGSARLIDLVWLAWLLVPLHLPPDRRWLPTLLVLLLFPGVHLIDQRLAGPALWMLRGAVFAAGVALFPSNPFAHTLFMYAGMPGTRATPREAVGVMIAVLAAAYAYFAWAHLETPYYAITSVVVLGIGATVLAQRARDQAREALAGKDQEIARLARLAERERIARDLHDLLGHTLTLIAIKSELAGRLVAPDPARAAEEIREVGAVARRSLSEVRQAIAGMHTLLLREALDGAAAVLTAAGLKVERSIAPLPALGDAEEAALAQAVTEASTNILRHARGARQVRLAVAQEQACLVLRVEDDGAAAALLPGNGLRGMQARLAALGGTVSLQAGTPGTRLMITLPWPAGAAVGAAVDAAAGETPSPGQREDPAHALAHRPG